MITEALGGPARRKVIVLLALVLGLQSADTATIGAAGAELERGLGIGNTELGLLASVTVLTGAVGSVPAGLLVDRVRRTAVLPAAIVVWSVAMLASAAAVSFLMLLVLRLALGGVIAVASPGVASLTGDYFPARERARIFGFILAGELVGGALGFLLSGEVAAVLSWRGAFALLALPGFALAWVIWRHLPEPARGGQSRLAAGASEIRSAEEVEKDTYRSSSGEEPSARPGGRAQEEVERREISPRDELVLREAPSRVSAWRAVRYVLSIPTNRILILASALGYFFLAGLQTFAVVFVKGHFGISQGVATGLVALILVSSVAGAVVGGRLADRFLDRGHVTARIVTAAVAYVTAAAIFVPSLIVGSLALVIPLYILAAMALAAPNAPLDAARLDIMPSQLWGRAEGVRSVLRDLGQALAPLVFGAVSERLGSGRPTSGSAGGFGAAANSQGLEYTFLVMLSALLLSGLVMVRARHSYPSDVATALASEGQMARYARQGPA